MLMRILKRLTQGGIYSNNLMAKDLGIDESLVEQMVIQLQHMGYIEKDSINSCSECCNCGGSKKSSCCSEKPSANINIWKITEKGRNALKKVG